MFQHVIKELKIQADSILLVHVYHTVYTLIHYLHKDFITVAINCKVFYYLLPLTHY
jgi:hypothetical protein